MVSPTAPDTIDATRRRFSKIARIEGYLALFFIFALFLGPLFPSLPPALAQAVEVTLWACGWLFAISGVCHGRGGARVAAVISLVILVLHASLILIIASLRSFD
jgi:hypothetical protein